MNDSMKPLARSQELLIKELPDELLIYDLIRHKAYCLNKSAAVVWNLCDGKNTIVELTHKSAKALNGSINEETVWLALEELEKSALLKTPIKRAGGKERITRRELARRLGIAAASIPLITAIIAPTSAHAASLRQNGESCSLSEECFSGCCDPVSSVCEDASVCGAFYRQIG